MSKTYIITLGGIRIGTTLLEKGDPPMGVAVGKICFEDVSSGYKLFREYCQKNNIQVYEDNCKNQFISTADIPNLLVSRDDGLRIEGVGTYVVGLESDFEISVQGIPYPFYEEEFPHHCLDYE